MQFSTKEDVEAPIAYVFARVTDVTTFERSALRRGMDVERMDRTAGVGVGSTWRAAFEFRGKRRDAEIKVTQFDPTNSFSVVFLTSGIEGLSTIDLVPLSRSRTRISVTVELSPKSIGARLLLQSLKLAKSSLMSKFKTRIANFAEDMEERYRSAAV